MRAQNYYILLAISLAILSGCKAISVNSSAVDNSIIGSWEGCDERIITFTKEENPTADGKDGEIIGRYTKLGKLERYKFTQNEIGYKLTEQGPGLYIGTVKWQDPNGNETWKKVSITIEDSTYKSDGSDRCSEEMKRVNP